MSEIYIHTEDVHNMTAPREVVPLVMDMVKPSSVLDVGCGTGTWLSAFEEAGIRDYLGIDGAYVQSTQLKIPAEKFKPVDLKAPWTLNRTFDLVVCLEVAEHLPQSSADMFVEALTCHADTILFSAAIPHQGGQHHINEQWPEYWQQKFAHHGFYFHDSVRSKIWSNEKVEWWYRQNIFLITRKQSEQPVLPLVHPELFKQKMLNENAYHESLISGKQGMQLSAKIFFNAVWFKLKKIF